MEKHHDQIDFYCDIINNMVTVTYLIDYYEGKYDIEKPARRQEFTCSQAAEVFCMECSYMPQIRLRMAHEIKRHFYEKYKGISK